MHLDEAAVARFVQGLRSSEDAREIRKHLASCLDCRKKVSEFGQVQQQAHKPRPATPPPEPDDPADVSTRGLPPVGRQATPEPRRDRARDEDDAATAALPKEGERAKKTQGPLTDQTQDDGRKTMPIPNAEPAPQLERGAMLGRYLVLHPLGEGGMGVVYSAYDPELDRKVAVKLLSASASEELSIGDGQARLLREAQAMARVSHPNVIAVYDVGTLDNRVFVAMELVEGGTLKDWIRQKKRSPKEILRAFVDAGRGLEAAHQAGLVHRDFKPENVLISKEGRVQVTDFGLARLVSSKEEGGLKGNVLTSIPKRMSASSDDRGRLLDAQITQMGLVMGTPQYMSPEQHLGRTPDARSDQFSFCAALYWALYGKRPFDPVQLAAAAVKLDEHDDRTRPERALNQGARLSIGKGVIQDPPKEPRVPNDVKKALVRGLSIDPAGRFPSMQELLQRLAPEPVSASRRWVTGVAAAGVVAAGVTLYISRSQQLCTGAERRLDGVWDVAKKEAITKQFLATGVPQAQAQDAVRITTSAIDGYARDWIAMHTEACVATRVRGEQTDEIMSRRMICLDRRLKELQALVDVLGQADVELVKRAYNAKQDLTTGLSSVKGCADVEGLSTLEGMPQDPNVQRQIGEIRDRVAHAQAQHIAGRPKDGLKLAETAASQALEISYRPLQAEALIVLGKLREKLQPDKAERTYIEAIKAAEAGRADEERVLAAIRMVNVLGSSGKHEQAQLWGELAQAVLDRLSGHEELQLELLVSLARSHLFAGANREALRAYEKALALSDKALPTDVRRGEIFNGLGILFVYPEFRDLDKSARALEQAIALVERTRGKNHPAVAYAHRSFIDTSVEKGDFKGALEHAQIAYDIFSSAFGPDHPDTLSVIEWRATVFFELRQYRESLVEAERALETRRASNPEDPELSYSYQNVGKALVALNRAQEAIPLLERCLKMFEADKSVHRKDLGEARYYLARALFESRRDQDRAIALANKAREDLIAGGKAKKADEVARWLAGLKRGGRSALGYRMRE